MNLATVLIILLANHGYWIAGQTYSVHFNWAVVEPMPAARIEWVVAAGEIPLAEGQVDLPADNGDGAELAIRAPQVRIPTQLTLRYTVRERDNAARELFSGTETIQVYPPIDLTPLVAAFGERELAIWDESGRLTALLESANLPHQTLDAAALLTARADFILVAPDMLQDENTFARLRDQAAGGTGVLILRQSNVDRLGDYPIARRAAAQLQWRASHPLLNGLPAEAWQSLVDGDQLALQIPLDHPALELAYYPPEVESDQPAPLDALLLTQTIGDGRIVFCQLPLGGWSDDPRAQAMVRSALHYLLTRPAPTPPHSQRRLEDNETTDLKDKKDTP